MERADEVLALGKVDTGLATDRRIDLGDEGRRDLEERDAAEPARGEEAGGVTERPAPDRHERLAALGAQPGQLACGFLDDRHPLRAFALRQQDPLDRPALVREGRRDRLTGRRPRSGLRDQDCATGAKAAERIGDDRCRDALADHEVAAERAAPEEHRWPRGARGAPDELVDPLDDRRQLGDPVHPLGRGVEPIAIADEIADRAHRIAPDDQGPDVRGAAETLGEDLGPDVEPDGHSAAIERPAVARVDHRSAAGGNHRLHGGAAICRAEAVHGFSLERPEPRLAALGEDLRDRLAGRLFDRVVEVDEPRPVTMGEPPPDRALAAAG